MDDRLLASRAIGGNLDSFGQLYDRYLNRVYDFAWRIVRDAGAAEDITREAFARAQRELPASTKAPSVQAWLFGIAHHAAISRAERDGIATPGASAEEAFGSFDVPDPLRIDDPAVTGGDHELAALTWEAVAALNARDYAMLDMHLRQQLDAGEIAHVTGGTKAATQTIITRMRQAAGGVVSSYIIARRGGESCEGLRAVIAGHPLTPYSDATRREIDAHIKGCETCSETQRALGDPLTVFAAFAVVAAPFALKGDLWHDLAGGWRRPSGVAAASSVGAASVARDANPYAGAAGGAMAAGGGPGGPPRERVALGGDDGGNDGSTNRLLLFGGAALGMIIFAFAGGAIIAMSLGGDDSPGGGPASTATARSQSGTPGGTPSPGVSVQTSTPGVTPSITVSPTPEETGTPLPTETAAPPPPPTEAPATATRTVRPANTPTATRTPQGDDETPEPPPGPSPTFQVPN